MPPKTTTVHALLKKRAEQQKQRARAEAAAAGAAPKRDAPDATKPMKRKAETTGYDARVYARFVVAVETLSDAQRGRSVPSEPDVWFVDAAHRWGELFERVDAEERDAVRLGSGSAARALPTPLPSYGAEGSAQAQSEEAYCKGYELWFLCGHASDAAPNADPSAEPSATTRNVLRPFTATYDNERGASRFKDAPFARPESLHRHARKAFERRRAERARLDAIRRAAETMHASATPTDVASSPATPPTSTPSPVVAESSKPTNAPVQKQHPNAVLPLFLKKPEETYKFGASVLGWIRTWVDGKVLQPQCVANIYFDQTKQKRSVRILAHKGDTAWQGQGLYEAMRAEWRINELRFEGGRVSNPDAFRSLGLALVGVGSYNTVWRFRAPSDERAAEAAKDSLRAALPVEAADALIRGDHVFRMPRPDEWSTHEAVRQEMINATEAATGGYGPLIAAMWVGSRREGTETGRHKSAHKLFMIVERGTPVDKRINDLHNTGGASTTTDKQWQVYMRHLRTCIWRVSADRCIAIDSKLSNFVDVFNDAADIGASTTTSPAVRVIDVDGRYYRRLTRLREEERVVGGVDFETAAGWRACWVYNVLVISCELRRVLSEATYFAHWWTPIQAAVNQVLVDAAGTAGIARGVRDAEYQRGREFLRSAQWAHPFRFAGMPPAPDRSDAPAALAQIATDNAKWYFHDAWYRWAHDRLVGPAMQFQLADAKLASARQQRAPNVAELEQARERARAGCANEWRAWYVNDFRPLALPMIRFFEHAAQPALVGARARESGRTLTETMGAYAAATSEDLHPYTNGKTPYANAAAREGLAKRPRVGSSTQQQLERATVGQAWPAHPLNYDEKWVLSVQWAEEQRAMSALGFGRAAIDEWRY